MFNVSYTMYHPWRSVLLPNFIDCFLFIKIQLDCFLFIKTQLIALGNVRPIHFRHNKLSNTKATYAVDESAFTGNYQTDLQRNGPCRCNKACNAEYEDVLRYCNKWDANEILHSKLITYTWYQMILWRNKTANAQAEMVNEW